MQHADRAVTCCFTGYRPAKLPWGGNESDGRCIELKNKLYDMVEAVYLAGVRHFICGMALGCDMYFAEAVMRLKAAYPDATFEAAIPCPGQSARWGANLRARYDYLVKMADFVSMLSPEYTPECMRKRNEYMIDASSVLIAVFDGKFGGTMMTVNYAKKKGLEIIQVVP